MSNCLSDAWHELNGPAQKTIIDKNADGQAGQESKTAPSQEGYAAGPVSWLPMETAPRTGERILIKDADIGQCVASAGWDNDKPEQIRWEVINSIVCEKPIGWLPLPPIRPACSALDEALVNLPANRIDDSPYSTGWNDCIAWVKQNAALSAQGGEQTADMVTIPTDKPLKLLVTEDAIYVETQEKHPTLPGRIALRLDPEQAEHIKQALSVTNITADTMSVPKEPTEAMMEAGDKAIEDAIRKTSMGCSIGLHPKHSCWNVYKAMLAAELEEANRLLKATGIRPPGKSVMQHILRAEAAERALKLVQQDVYNLTEKVIPNIKEAAERQLAEKDAEISRMDGIARERVAALEGQLARYREKYGELE